MTQFYQKAILPRGFKANAVACGLKKSGKPDLALFYSEAPAKAACVFTANQIQAAPIKVCQGYLKSSSRFQAIIANSGNANCFTGKAGLRAAQEMTKAAAASLNLKKNNVLVASTGIIARPLPLGKIKKAIPQLAAGLSKFAVAGAKKAIMTTDSFAKEVTVKFAIGRKVITICGIAKGAGMIAPQMATMLAFIFTDAKITRRALSAALNSAVGNSFNCITVDGCMSTNDSVMLLANAQAANPLIAGGRSLELFTQGLNTVCLELAKMIVKDAEGATKFIRIQVKGAKSHEQAKRAALAIANSNLFKTAMFASSPNFLGRVVAAVGASGSNVKEEELKIKCSSLPSKEIELAVYLGKGRATATVYTSDLTCEYIKINAHYN
jgi:glutamate N-acetyltransferase/amino-acid N-acetyltransferase